MYTITKTHNYITIQSDCRTTLNTGRPGKTIASSNYEAYESVYQYYKTYKNNVKLLLRINLKKKTVPRQDNLITACGIYKGHRCEQEKGTNKMADSLKQSVLTQK